MYIVISALVLERKPVFYIRTRKIIKIHERKNNFYIKISFFFFRRVNDCHVIWKIMTYEVCQSPKLLAKLSFIIYFPFSLLARVFFSELLTLCKMYVAWVMQTKFEQSRTISKNVSLFEHCSNSGFSNCKTTKLSDNITRNYLFLS